MESVTWQTIELPQSAQLADARRQAHNAVHWLARIANSYIAPGDDNSHVAINWDDKAGALRTQSFSDNLNVELRIAQLQLQFCENGQPVPHILSFEERTPAHVEAWILVELLHRGVERTSFTKELPYPAADLMLGDSEEHAPGDYIEELASLDGWLRNGAAVCSALRHDLRDEAANGVKDDPLTLWPQTFQLGIELPLPVGSGAPTLRVGISAGDNLRPEPFFFVGTPAQTIAGDFAPDSILSSRRILEQNLTSDDVINFLKDGIASQRKRLAG